MQSNAEIKVIKNTDKQFYKLMGPFLSQRFIVKELGYNVWDDMGKVWIVATKNGIVKGFCACKYKGSKVEFCSDYVLPEHRGHRVYDKLFQVRLGLIENRYCFAKATDKSLNTYLRYGFKQKRQTGRYTLVERIINNE